MAKSLDVVEKQGFFSRLNPFSKNKSYNTVPQSAGWWRVFEPYAGAWQRNVEWKRETVLAYHAVFSCVTLIASDISKLRPRIVREANGIWSEIPYGIYSVLEKPNSYQNRIQFFESWLASKLSRGNAYILKGRDSRGNVNRMWVLNPDLVLPVVTDSGDVFYQLSQDRLADVATAITVPASEIIHDRFNCLFHPLVGLSPIFACGLAAYQGLKIQENSAYHFQNLSRPGGVLTAPGAISDEVAGRLKAAFEENYGGKNIGRIAVLGDDLKFQPLTMTAEESQMVEQLRLTAEVVCSTFHVPRYKVIGDLPSFNNVQAFEQQYYSQCLQSLIESIELCLDEGLEIEGQQGVEFDLDGLLRMDTKTQMETLREGVSSGLVSPNEGRKKINLPPVDGGQSPYLQQQNYSLTALAKRDATDDPFNKQQAAQPEPDMAKFAYSLKKHLKDIKYV